jgi:hypothetical protein
MSDGLESAALSSVNVSTIAHNAMHASSSYDASTEESLVRRYGKSKKKHSELVFEFTRDPALIHQYHRIYEEQFRIVHQAVNYRSVQDEHDRNGYIMIVREGNLCVGGARLSVKTPRKPQPLPIEMNEFRLANYFPKLEQKEMKYGQIGRFCLLPEYWGGTATRLLLTNLYRKSVALGLDMIFGTAPISNARAYMKNFSAMGLKEPKIHFDIDLPPYPMCEEIKFYLVSVVVNKLVATNEKNHSNKQNHYEEI